MVADYILDAAYDWCCRIVEKDYVNLSLLDLSAGERL